MRDPHKAGSGQGAVRSLPGAFSDVGRPVSGVKGVPRPQSEPAMNAAAGPRSPDAARLFPNDICSVRGVIR
ncbi:hypothetical protein XFLAVUS301_35170 [Xanthobacter flavus]|uniref:Uncharacterized protein n=1 Tax=Xanthobacter flavus TaxID=281 RepID=A0A9W6CU01_XANFL|nr:hypothetical protein XFLAVUS301_35170 [Xanthobacter flavus]